MKKWYVLIVVTFCWAGGGFFLFEAGVAGSSIEQDRGGSINRIVSLAPNLTEILFELGLCDEIVAVTTDSDWPSEAKGKPKVGTFWQCDIEAVIAARPQLVVTVGFAAQRRLARRLERIGYDCLTVNIEEVSGLFEAIERIGQATGKGAEASELVRGIKTKLGSFSGQNGLEKKVRVLYVVERERLQVAGRGTFINEMIELAGGENAIGPTMHQYPPIGAEEVIASGAEVIIESSMGQRDIKAQLENAIRYWSRFRNLPAVKNNRIYVIDASVVSRLGPRLCQSVETIRRCLRPELFAN